MVIAEPCLYVPFAIQTSPPPALDAESIAVCTSAYAFAHEEPSLLPAPPGTTKKTSTYSYAPIVGVEERATPRASVITPSTTLPAPIAELPSVTAHVCTLPPLSANA